MNTPAQAEATIRNRSKRTHDVESYVNYYGNDVTPIEGYPNAKLYASQTLIGGGFSVSFMNGREMIIFATNCNEESIDRKSYDKYGGLMYTTKPMTEEVINLIISID